MKTREKLSDYDHPSVQKAAARLTNRETTVRGKLERLFHYVRDDIKFGFHKKWDLIKASQIIELGLGQCNNKSTLFLALCQAVGIPARVHYGLIKTEIMRGIFPGIALVFMPRQGSHSWLEVEVEGKWRRIDSYIVDKELFEVAKRGLLNKGWNIGYAVACPKGKCSCEFNIDREEFVQMGAVVGDHGIWGDASEFYATENYVSMNAVLFFSYKLMMSGFNKKIEEMRTQRGKMD